VGYWQTRLYLAHIAARGGTTLHVSVRGLPNWVAVGSVLDLDGDKYEVEAVATHRGAFSRLWNCFGARNGKSDMDITIAGTLADNYPVGALVARSTATGGLPAEQGDLFVPRLCRPRHAVLTSPEAKELEKPFSESSESYSARVLSV